MSLLPWTLCCQTILWPAETGESPDEYCEETDTQCPLAKLQEQFWQLWEQLAHLKPVTHLPAHMTELTQLTDELQHLTMTLQPHPTLQPNEEPHAHNCASICIHPACHTERDTPPYILTKGYPYVQWTRLLKTRGLTHGPRNCH